MKKSPDAGTRPTIFSELTRYFLSFNLGSFRCDFLQSGCHENRDWSTPLHQHSYFEACYVFKGAGIFRLSGDDYPIGLQQIFLSKPGQLHEIIPLRKQPLGIYFLAFNVVAHNNPKVRNPGIDELIKALLDSKRCVSAPKNEIQHTINLLNAVISSKELGYERLIESLGIKLLLDIARALIEKPLVFKAIDSQPQNRSEATVQRAALFLRDNHTRSITIKDVAAEIHLSKRHIERLFRGIMGTSIRNYLIDLRMETASRLLLDPQLSIKEIAYQIGYGDTHFFSTLFRQRVGLTPSAFREKNKKRLKIGHRVKV